jgi:hypothetical protein
MPAAFSANPAPDWRKRLGLLLFALAVAYLAWLFAKDTAGIAAALGAIAPWRFAAAIVLLAAMSLLKTCYHANLLGRITGRTQLSATVAAAYAQAQVVRYLPGKVWGFLHQANQLSRRFSAQEVMLANLLQMLTTNILAVGVIASVLGCLLSGSRLPLLGLPVTLLVVELLHRNPLLERTLVRLAVIASRGRVGTRVLLDVPVAPSRWLATTILAAEWMFYFAAWSLLANGMLELTSALALATWYAAASLLSILAIAVPAGLVVREAIFVSLSGLSAVPQATLVVLAAAMRLAMTAGEVLCIPVTLAYRKLGRDHHE